MGEKAEGVVSALTRCSLRELAPPQRSPYLYPQLLDIFQEAVNRVLTLKIKQSTGS